MTTDTDRLTAISEMDSKDCDEAMDRVYGFLHEPHMFTCHETELSVVRRFIDEVLLEGWVGE